jgi:cytochrome oxidase complex assembly protein 1
MSTPYQPVPIEQTGMPPRRGWWSRNWKWFVPTLVLLLCLLIAAFVFGILALVFGSMKMSEPYKYAMDQAQHAPVVVQRIGQPVESSTFISGQINVAGPTGHADLSIPISGPKGKATVYVVGDKSAGKWTYQTLEVQFEGDPNRVSLLNPTGSF